MRDAAKHLVGTHDFRNYCKKDKSKPNQTFVREIFFTSIEPVMDSMSSSEMHVFTIKGSGFLHHQVRCIMAVLFSVGRGLDEPSVSVILRKQGPIN